MPSKLSVWTCLIAVVLITLFNVFYIRPPLSSTTHFHKVLYLDPHFTPQEAQIITDAANEWTEATHHIAEFDVVQLPATNVDLSNGILVSRATHRDPKIMLVDAIAPKGSETLGVCNPFGVITSIELVSDRAQNDAHDVILHELGHAIGLKHNDKLFTLMYPMIDYGSDYITDYDLEKFCEIYHCDPKQLNQ